MSLPLYGRGMKGSWKLLVVFAAVLALYFSVIITMFDPERGSAIEELARTMPELMSMMGMGDVGTTLLDFMGNYLYGFLMLVFPMVFSILCANRLVAQYVDRGAMVWLLAAPVRRLRIVLTQLLVLASGILLLVAFATGLGIVTAEAMFPGALDIPAFLLLNLAALGLQLFIGSLCFFSSCLFNDTKYSIALGAGLPALCFLVQMLANTGDELEKAKYFTFFTLFNPAGIIAGEMAAMVGAGVLFGGAIGLSIAAIVFFCKKDMPV